MMVSKYEDLDRKNGTVQQTQKLMAEELSSLNAEGIMQNCRSVGVLSMKMMPSHWDSCLSGMLHLSIPHFITHSLEVWFTISTVLNFLFHEKSSSFWFHHQKRDLRDAKEDILLRFFAL